MKRKLFCGLMAFLLLFSFAACTNSPVENSEMSQEEFEMSQESSEQALSETKPIPIVENYWNLACENTYVTFYHDSPCKFLEYELVSAFPLKEDELVVEVEADAEIKFTASYIDVEKVEGNENEAFPLYIYQCYQDVDWTGDLSVFKKENLYRKEYEVALSNGELPQLYRYRFMIAFDFDQLDSVVNVNALKLTLRGQTKRFELGSLILDGVTENTYVEAPVSQGLVVSDAPIHISEDGTIDLTFVDSTAQEPVTLTGVSFFENDSDITEFSLVLTQTDGTVTEMIWDGHIPIQVLEGEQVSMRLGYKDARFAGVLEGSLGRHIEVHYLSADGKECSKFMQGTYRVKQGLYDLYAADNGADVLSYYLDFFIPKKAQVELEG